MTPVKMEATSDCFQACLASVLDLPLEDVPNLLTDLHTRVGDTLPTQTMSHLRHWMMDRDIFPVFLPLMTVTHEGALELSNEQYPGTYAILSGLTRKGILHAVVIRDGKVIHDPAPVGQGLLYPFIVEHVRMYQLFLVGKII